MDYSLIITLLGFLFAARLLGIPATLTGIGLYYAVGFFGYWPVIAVIGLLCALLLGGIYMVRRSVTGAFAVFLSIGFVGFSWFLSRFSKLADSLGRLFPCSQIFSWLLTLYPGQNFIERTREDIVQRGAEYIEEGKVDVEMDRSGTQLVNEAHMHAKRAGIHLSNGEVFIGIVLAVISIRPFPFTWVNPPTWVGAVLSVTFVVVVMLRLTAVNALLYHQPTLDQGIARLHVMRDWNNAVSNGVSAWWYLTLIRAMTNVSEDGYHFYLDWVLREAIVGSGADKLDVWVSLWKPLRSFNEADVRGITPSEASKLLYGVDVFASPKFADLGYADAPINNTKDATESPLEAGDLN